MLEYGFLVDDTGFAVILADDDCELAAGITENGGSVHALNALQNERAPGANSIGKGLMLSEAVCVPRHIQFSGLALRRWGRLHFCEIVRHIRIWKKGRYRDKK